MKNLILPILSFVTIFSFVPKVFAQAQTVDIDCKVSAIYEIYASYDASKNTLSVTKKMNGETATYAGVSFEQLNKVSLNKDSDILAVAKAIGFSLSAVNSANRYVLTAGPSNDKIELIDFINVDGESLGSAAILGPKSQMCL